MSQFVCLTARFDVRTKKDEIYLFNPLQDFEFIITILISILNE